MKENVCERERVHPKPEWKNTPDLYNDYCYFEECSLAMQQLLKTHGWFFDDNWFYWLVKGGFIVKRRPLYWHPQKSTPSEKVRLTANLKNKQEQIEKQRIPNSETKTKKEYIRRSVSQESVSLRALSRTHTFFWICLSGILKHIEYAGKLVIRRCTLWYDASVAYCPTQPRGERFKSSTSPLLSAASFREESAGLCLSSILRHKQ